MIPVPRRWAGATVICLASGPSVTPEDVGRCQGHPTIAINCAYQLAPWAEALIASDARWWQWHDGVPSFQGVRYTLQPNVFAGTARMGSGQRWAHVLRNLGRDGLSHDPTGMYHGEHSGYAAINLAWLGGAERVLLLGYDCQPSPSGAHHVHPPHPASGQPAYSHWRDAHRRLAPIAEAAGLTIVNCSRATALTCYPRQTLEEALCSGVLAS